MKMSAAVRTIFRKMLRDHPNILMQLNNKSEVNNLTRDDLIKIADNLGINFLQRLADVEADFDPCNNGVKLTKDSNFSAPFIGKIEFSSDVIAFNINRKVNLLVEYEYVPDWQFYCPVQKRLKYRCQGLSIKTYFQSTMNKSDEGVANNSEEFGWHFTSDTIWNLFDPAVINEVNLAIDKQAWKLDQERRTAADLSPKMRGKPTLLDGGKEKSKLRQIDTL